MKPFQATCERVATVLSESARSAGRAQALVFMLAAFMVTGLSMLVARRHGGWSFGSLVPALIAGTGLVLLLSILYAGVGYQWAHSTRLMITMAAVHGWWVFVIAWVVELRWFWVRCRENFVAMDMEDVERLIKPRAGLIPGS